MTHPHRRAVLAVIAGLAGLAGCVTGPKSLPPQDPAKDTAARTEKFVVLAPPGGLAVECTGLQERVLPDGRLEVVASLKNRADQLLKLQANCVFRDVDGSGIGDETAFQPVALPAGATLAVRFTSQGMQARRYTVCVRPMP